MAARRTVAGARAVAVAAVDSVPDRGHRAVRAAGLHQSSAVPARTVIGISLLTSQIFAVGRPSHELPPCGVFPYHLRMTAFILMGVAGSGKTTVGKQVSQRLGLPFYEGDDFHPPQNVAKMP